VLIHLLPAAVAQLCIYHLDVDAPESWRCFFWFSLTNPLFIYAVSFLFDSDGIASIIIRIVYFVLGGLGPIAIMVLQPINPRCLEISVMLEDWFVWMPVYNFNFGYLSIVNREIFSLLMRNHRLGHDTMKFGPLDWRVAGKPLYLLQNQMIYSLIALVLFEVGLFRYLKRKVFNRVFDSIHRTILYLYACISGDSSMHMGSQFSDFNAMKGLSVVDTEAVLKIVDQDPLDEAKRV